MTDEELMEEHDNARARTLAAWSFAGSVLKDIEAL